MAVPKAVSAQRDFSAGELDVTTKRADQSQAIATLLKSGGRQCSNFRILNSGSLQRRPGRTALFMPGNVAQNLKSRTEEIVISPGVTFRFVFTAGTLDIYDINSVRVFHFAVYGWTTATLNLISIVVLQKAVFIACEGTQPVVLSWTGGTAWNTAPYVASLSAGGQRRTLFYRQSQLGVSMTPSATSGAAIILTFNATICTPNMVGTLMRFCGRQILIAGYTDPQHLVGSTVEYLPTGQQIQVVADPRTTFNVGDVIVGSTSGAKGYVTATSTGPNLIAVQLLQSTTSTSAATSGASSPSAPSNSLPGLLSSTIAATTGAATTAVATTLSGFVQNEIVVGPGGSTQITNAGGGADVVNTAPQGCPIWDEEVFNAQKGYPGSVFADQGRLGFCNFPNIPNGIAWSAYSSPFDTYVDAQPTSAFFELAPDKVQVYFVVPGPESSEFVFCDRRVYYIPISPTNPLKPGSVGFQILSGEGCAKVQPRAVQEIILYINAGSTSVMGIVATGTYSRPFQTRNLTELHSHLIKSPIAIAVPTATMSFEERYIYLLNNDGTLAVGKYSVEDGLIKGAVGWVPWSTGNGTIDWVSAHDAVVLFATRYSPNGIRPVCVIEQLDDVQYLDCGGLVNSMPAPFIVAGRAPFWWLAGGSVDLIDLGTRTMGTYQIDPVGAIIPQNTGGENLASAQLAFGQFWGNSTFEPFVPMVQPGTDQLQRMRKRRISRAEIYVSSSSGFLFQRFNADQQGTNLPALGAVMSQRRIPAWNEDDDATLPPPLREKAYAFKPQGRAHDPRVAVVKDTPGPFVLEEIGMEVTV